MKHIGSCLFLTFTILCSCSRVPKDKAPPNIILILADDLGYGDLHSYGGEFDDTPNLDRMAREGMVFTDFHSNCPVCSPARAALLSGQYQQRVGIETVVYAKRFRHTGINPGTYTLASYASSLGYSTAIMGKWHLGYDTVYSPLNFGFDYFRGYVSGNVDYHSHIDGAGFYDWWEQKDTLVEPGYSTDLITKSAVSFIRENKDTPFFLYVAHEAPHSPYQGRGDNPVRVPGGAFREQESPADLQKTYREMIAAMDEGVGAIFNALERSGLMDNTFVFFFSDNGANRTGSNDPFRGYKSSLWEGGHRVPAIAFWKGRIEPGSSGEFLLGMDLFPTIAAVAGKDVQGDIRLDGVDFSAVLLNRGSMGERTAFWRYNGERSVRKGPWKLLVLRDSTYLFNLSDDPSEQVNILHQNPGISDSLLHMLKDWEEEMNTYTLNTY
jgi:arylsulfatase A